jgi:hypothetical protein
LRAPAVEVPRCLFEMNRHWACELSKDQAA